MLGWLISVDRVADEASVRRSLRVSPGVRIELDAGAVAERLATWQAAIEGLDWIRQAASCEGGIVMEREGGYPHRFLARAADIFTAIRNRRPYKAPLHEYPSWVVPEGSVLMPGYVGKTTIDEDAMNRCADDEWLYIEVWDES